MKSNMVSKSCMIVLICLIMAIAAGCSKNSNLNDYKGYWYVGETLDSMTDGSLVVDLDEINIKQVVGNSIVFDYALAMLCSDEDIEVELIDGIGDFESNFSIGTIKLIDDKIELLVENANYTGELTRTFDKKLLEKVIVR